MSLKKFLLHLLILIVLNKFLNFLLIIEFFFIKINNNYN